MTDKEIIIKDYFNIMRDENGRIFCIQEIGDPKSLIKAIREQNEYIQAKEQEYEELKSDLTDLSKIIDCKNGTILTFKEQLDQLKAENEQWQKELDKTHLLMLQKQDELIKAEQTLAEIKEIAEQISLPMGTGKSSNRVILANQILQKINGREQ